MGRKRLRRCTKEPCDVCDMKEAFLMMGLDHLVQADDIEDNDDRQDNRNQLDGRGQQRD